MRMIQRFKDIKLRHKLMYIYVAIGIFPILLLGIFTYTQVRSILIEKEEKNIENYLQQSVNNLDNQMKIYDSMSDYIAYNRPVSKVLNTEYTSSYDMYEQYTMVVDPVLSSLKYFNSNVKQITIYNNADIVQHDTTIAPMSDVSHYLWCEQSLQSQEARWYADASKQKAFTVRQMPIIAQAGNQALLYVEVNYEDLFSCFEGITQNNYGIYILDENENVVYEYNNYADEKDRTFLNKKDMLKEYQKLEKGKKSKYMIVPHSTSVENWTVWFYRTDRMVVGAMQPLTYLTIIIILVCIGASILASIAFSKFIVSDIERLTENMEAVEEGNMDITVVSEAQDEVGNLIRGFGKMIAKIKQLISEVYESKITQKEYEMRALQAQINPHFLYNSLSLINWKAIETGQDDISKITLALSTFYRTSLNKGKNVLTVEQELENMKSYLEIQSVMHDNDFDVVMDIDDAILPYTMLNLILQPLIENAIDHGIDLKEDGRGYIKIVGRLEEKTIYLCVEDNGIGMPQDIVDTILETKSKGYGVRNVNQRIKLYYGEEYGLCFESTVGIGTKCIVRIPY